LADIPTLPPLDELAGAEEEGLLEVAPFLDKDGDLIKVEVPEPTEEELLEREEQIRLIEEQMAREKSKQLTAPVSLDFELLENILNEVQDETQSKLEGVRQRVARRLFMFALTIFARRFSRRSTKRRCVRCLHCGCP